MTSCFTGIGVAVVWTGIGCAIAALQGEFRTFLRNWVDLQGFFLVLLGTWLLLTIRSDVFSSRVEGLTVKGVSPNGLHHSRLRYLIVGVVSLIGTASLMALGFPAGGVLLVFMWCTCACVCVAAGLVTLHTAQIMIVMHQMQRIEIKAFKYAPARTPELRSLLNYCSSFSLLTTIAYGFALAATIQPPWTGSKDYIGTVQVFWPIIYVPLCSLALVYPHVIVHRLIQREKERTLLSCQRDIDDLLTKYSGLSTEEVERTNTLAQLFDRISATPDYVIDVGVAARTLLPLVFNLVTLFAKVAVGQH